MRLQARGKGSCNQTGGTPSPLVNLDEVSREGPVFEGTDVPVQCMFEYVDEVNSLHAFLNDFPEVSMEQALAPLRERVDAISVVHSNRNFVSGTPVLKGTRVPVRGLFECLAAGYTVEVFFDKFPTAERDQVARTLEIASELLERIAFEATAR